MTPIVGAAWALFGLAVGSFANVCVARFPYGEGVVRGRSRCPHCGVTLRAWPDLLPVASWVLLGGRCRACRGPISARYPALEIFMAVLFALAFWKYPDDLLRLAWTSFWLGYFLVVAAIDLETRLILNQTTYPGAVAAVLGNVFLFDVPLSSLWRSPVFGAFAAGWLMLAVGWLGRVMFRKEAMGLGDVKLMLVLGGLFGLGGALRAFLVGSVVGGVVSLLLVALGRVELRGTVAYGPFLALGGMLELLGWTPALW